MYPEGVWFLFFKGRLEFMKGNLDDSLYWYVRLQLTFSLNPLKSSCLLKFIRYKKSWRSQDVWPQFHHLCFWELLWVNW